MRRPRLAVVVLLLALTGCSTTTPFFGIDLTPPRIVAVSPQEGATGVELTESVTVLFDEPIIATPNSIRVIDESGIEAIGEVTIGTSSLEFSASMRWHYLADYEIHLSGVANAAGLDLPGDPGFAFQTRDLQWQSPVAVSTTSSLSAYLRSPVLDVSPDGTAVAVWTQVGDLWAALRDPGSGAWVAERVDETDILLGAVAPSIATLSSGFVLIWEERDPTNTRYDVKARFRTKAGWSASTLLEESTNSAGEGFVATDGATQGIAVFDEFGATPGNVRYNPLLDESWGSSQLVELSANETEDPHLAMSADGTAFAVWVETEASELNLRANRKLSGGSWSTFGVLVDAASTPVIGPKVGVWNADHAIAVWSQDVAGYHVLYSIYDGGDWSAPIAVSSSASVFDFCFALGPEGTAIVVSGTWAATLEAGIWTLSPSQTVGEPAGCFLDARGNGAAVWSMSAGGGRFDLHARRFLSGLGWGDLTLAEDEDGGSVDRVGMAKAAPDGTADLVWIRNPASNQATAWATRFE